MRRTSRRQGLRWVPRRREPLGYTANYGAVGNWKVRNPAGRYVATTSGSPLHHRPPKYEVEHLLRGHKQSCATYERGAGDE